MELPVIVERVIYRNDKGFAILAVNLNAYSSCYDSKMEDLIPKKDNKYNNFIASVSDGEHDEDYENRQYIMAGDFVVHPKFGNQFKATFHFKDQPKTEDGFRFFLMTLPNIKEARSLSIIKKWGVDETIRILDEDPKKLIKINGLTEKRVEAIVETWKKEKEKRELYFWLIEHGIAPVLGKPMHAKWGCDAREVLEKNPYMMTEIKGIGFVKADEVAHKILKTVPKPFRVKACMEYVLKENLIKNSNLCMPYAYFKKEVLKTLKQGSEINNPTENIKDYLPLIPECIKKETKHFVGVKNKDENQSAYIYLKDIYDKERFIAKSIYNRYNSKENNDKVNDLERSLEEVSENGETNKIVFDPKQKDAIKSGFEHKITVITGPAGSGKTTICKAIISIAEKHRLSVRLMAPTGKAAQVLSEKTFFPAETIHRSLKMKPGDDYPKEEINEDIVIIDETSMLGIDTMNAIMFAIQNNLLGNIVFVGDANQLPSVSPGNFLKDIMASECANIVKLDKIHRQDERSYIALLANEVSKGKIVEIPEDAKDIKWHDLVMIDDFEVAIRTKVHDFIANNSIDDLQFLSCMYRGNYGVNKINEIVQELMAEINGNKDRVLERPFQKYYIGDRVIQTENDYQKEIFNGDMGIVIDAGNKVLDPSKSDQSKNFLEVDFYGKILKFVDDEINSLKLAWCCTVHKYQGSQSSHVAFVFSRESHIMESKEILYTAMTRASKFLNIYGHRDVFRSAPSKSVIRKRFTNFCIMVKEMKENRSILKVAGE